MAAVVELPSKQEESWSKAIFGSPVDKESPVYLAHLSALEKLTRVSVIAGVTMPPGMSRQHWIAVKTLTIYLDMVSLCAQMQELCDGPDCVDCMKCDPGDDGPTGVGRRFYEWFDEEDQTSKTYPAMVYVRALIGYAYELLSDPRRFPVADGDFPDTFDADVHNLFLRFFHVFSHLAAHHYHEDLRPYKACGQYNDTFRHFLLVVDMLHLLTDEEMHVMRDALQTYRKYDKLKQPQDREAWETSAETWILRCRDRARGTWVRRLPFGLRTQKTMERWMGPPACWMKPLTDEQAEES